MEQIPLVPIGKALIFLGLVLVGIGLFLVFGTKIPGLSKLGNLPGDIRIKKENYSLYFPWVTCLVLSGLATLISLLYRMWRQ